MKTSEDRVPRDATQRRPASTTAADAPAQRHTAEPSTEDALQRRIDDSPRVLAQRQVIDTRFGPAGSGTTALPAGGVAQRVLEIGGKLVRGGQIVNGSERPPELTQAIKGHDPEILTELYRMHQAYPKQHRFGTWQDAVNRAERSLSGEVEAEASNDNEDREDRDDGSSSRQGKWESLFQELSRDYRPYLAKIEQEFKQADSASSTGANDAHQSLMQSAIWSAKAMAMEAALLELKAQGCPKSTLTRLRKKKVSAETKAKQKGETHHMSK